MEIWYESFSRLIKVELKILILFLQNSSNLEPDKQKKM